MVATLSRSVYCMMFDQVSILLGFHLSHRRRIGRGLSCNKRFNEKLSKFRRERLSGHFNL